MELESWRSDLKRNAIKQEIKNIFDEKIRGKEPVPKSNRENHDGWEGHWLEEQFGVVANNRNEADYKGFEIKDSTGSKTTFGDWPVDEYIFFSHKKCAEDSAKASACPKCKNSQLNRDKEFLHIFGTPNPKKKNRYSWSGSVFPKVGETNFYGQTLEISNDGDVKAIYHFSKDERENKNSLLPENLKIDYVVLAKWRAASLKEKLKKFGRYGWAKCVQPARGHGIYTAIEFGRPINFDAWLEGLRKGIIILDSGMYEGNRRPYSCWRASNSYWAEQVEETYPEKS